LRFLVVVAYFFRRHSKLIDHDAVKNNQLKAELHTDMPKYATGPGNTIRELGEVSKHFELAGHKDGRTTAEMPGARVDFTKPVMIGERGSLTNEQISAIWRKSIKPVEMSA